MLLPWAGEEKWEVERGNTDREEGKAEWEDKEEICSIIAIILIYYKMQS